MADSLISFVITRLGEALIQEVVFLSEVRGQFERCQAELRSIEGFFKTVDAMSFKNPDMLAWVASVQDVAYDMDDVLSEFFIEAAEEKRRSKNFLEWIACFPAKRVNSHKMGKEIEAIFIRIEDVSNRRKRYAVEMGQGASSSTTNDVVRLRKTFHHVKDDHLVGLEEAASSLVAELMKEEDRRCVVSICGMGGLGKTTLAKLVYNCNEVKEHFDVCAWTFISQQCKAGDAFQDILRQVSSLGREEIQKMNEVELVETLSNTLGNKRYLVVLDDIWKVEAWIMLKSAFPNGLKGSKVMLTTRNEEVAAEADPRSRPITPECLNEEQAWDLMRKISFPLANGMEECGRGMLKKCGGLPLAIVVLGGILARKKSLNEWKTVSELIGVHMREGKQIGVHAILGLSIIDLPLHLKPLFLYLGLFPEDYKIPVGTLIRMWIAEGLLSELHGNQVSMESIGRHYLDELIQRCVVQVAERNLQGGVKTCQMHDMMLDVCINKAREENFLEIIKEGMSMSALSSTKLRRCAIYLEDKRYVFPPQATPCMRTVIFIETPKYKPSSFHMDYKDFKLVKVLELEHVSQPKLEDEIGKLINLRYLGLRDSHGLEKLPKSIGNLVNLQTLDLKYCFIVKIPDVIWKLEELRHFLWWQTPCLLNTPLRMDSLRKLETLSWMRAESWSADMLNLVNLQKLGIVDLKPGQVGAVIDSIVDRFPKLRSLSLKMSTYKYLASDSFSNLERLSEMRQLLKLELNGRMNSFLKHWPPNIVKLEVYSSYSNEDPMPILEKLEHLACLKLWWAYEGEKVVCGGEGFPKLEYLHIGWFQQLEEFVVEKGAMPGLRECVLLELNKLKKLPEGFKFLTTLQKLEIIDMDSTVREGGRDWESVKHIPSIIVKSYRRT